MNLTNYMTNDYENKPPLRTMEKQTQTKPTCSELARPELAYPELVCGELARTELVYTELVEVSKYRTSRRARPELACGELVEPVEGVEPISCRAKSSWLKAKWLL